MRTHTLLQVAILASAMTASSHAAQNEICQSLSRHGTELHMPLQRRENGEHILGTYCKDEHRDSSCSSPILRMRDLVKMGLPVKDELLSSNLDDFFDIHFSKVDIDNDGIEEIRAYGVFGSAHCTYSWFYKQAPGGMYHLSNSHGYEILNEEGNLCDEYLLFPKLHGKTYVMSAGSGYDKVWLGSTSKLQQICLKKGQKEQIPLPRPTP